MISFILAKKFESCSNIGEGANDRLFAEITYQTAVRVVYYSLLLNEAILCAALSVSSNLVPLKTELYNMYYLWLFSQSSNALRSKTVEYHTILSLLIKANKTVGI